MRMEVILVLFAVLFLLNPTTADDSFENSTNVCKRCICNKNEAEFTLDCKRTGMQYVLANWPEEINITTRATFSFNKIISVGRLPPSDFIAEITFDHCSIKYIVPGFLVNVKNIEFLDLSYNELTSEQITPEQFKGPNNNDTVWERLKLKYLDLSYNKIHTLDNNLFEHTDGIEELNLEGNDFRLLDVSTQMAISSMKKLQRLNLANNELTELIPEAIDGLQNLIELNLSNNLIDFVPKSLAHVSDSLEMLDMSGNPIFDLSDSTFIVAKNLIELSLNNLPELKLVGGNTFSSLPKLRKLEMSNNQQLHMIDVESFPIQTNLEELYLNNNSLTNLDYPLLEWHKIKVLEFRDNPLKCSCDLFNIKKNLDARIVRNPDGPMCRDERTGRSREVYYLNSDICSEENDITLENHTNVQKHFNVLRIVLVILSVIIFSLGLVTLGIFYLRYRKFQRNRSYPFAAEVNYNPLNTQYL